MSLKNAEKSTGMFIRIITEYRYKDVHRIIFKKTARIRNVKIF